MFDRVLGTVPNHILAGVVVLSDMLFAHTNSTFEDWPQVDHPHHEAKWSRSGAFTADQDQIPAPELHTEG